ncbi:MAG: hypothetical protein L6Q71_10080, partial [Planctomycetes bacterium]|nr:hypothetical protein [Planctomycetota bacterium]
MTPATLASLKEDLQELTRNPGCDYLEIRAEDTEKTSFRFLGKELETLDNNRSGGAAIRALVNGRWGFVTINDLDELERGVADAVEAAKTSAQLAASTSVLASIEPQEVAVPLNMKRDPHDVPLSDKIELFGRYNDRVLAGKGITSSNTYYFDTRRRLTLVTSEGTCVEKEDADIGCSVAAIANRNGETRTASVSQGSSDDYGVTGTLGAELDGIIEAAVAMLDAPVVEAGTYTV